MDILFEIISNRQKQIKLAESKVSLTEIKTKAEKAVQHKTSNRFLKALQNNRTAIIAEVKKASPSKGIICEDFNYLQIAKEYKDGGAAAISVLTEESYFQGHLNYLYEIAQTVDLPILRKDFIVNEYQIYEAALNGASAILLIASVLSEKQLETFQELAQTLKMGSLVEVHNEAELTKVLKLGAQIIGINNRNLRDFSVSLEKSYYLGKQIPDHIIKVSESGIHNRDDIIELEKNGFQAALIGETLMRQTNRAAYIKYLQGL
jgi:indole-3-glycerol phosphate synthase